MDKFPGIQPIFHVEKGGDLRNQKPTQLAKFSHAHVGVKGLCSLHLGRGLV